ncbi:MAG: hypothetical protein HRT88_12385 [Lentisphaeraceae bacterium]|nr:hypothetical protein [Lentisphaeraceae bacterium]
MKKLILALLLSFLAPLFSNEIKHRFIAMDNYSHAPQLIYVDQFNAQKSWTLKLPVKKGGSYRSIQLLDKQRLLINHPDGAVEYDLLTGQKSAWSVSGYKGIQCALRLPDGRTILATPNKLYYLDSKGQKIKEKKLLNQPAGRVRILTLTKDKTILYAAHKPFSLCEISLEGEFIKSTKLSDKGYRHLRLANGNTLNSSGNECQVFEADATGKVIAFVGGKKQHPKLKLDFTSGWSLLDNGNIVMTNWLGHGKVGTAVQLIEFNRQNKVVWIWDGRAQAKTITNVLVIK